MSMDVVAEALLFWKIVEVSLVELYGWELEAAHARVLTVRGRMIKRAIVQDISYHWSPLSVAHGLSTASEPISDEMLHSYRELIRRVTAQFSADVITEKTKERKPRLNASRQARSIAALAQ